MSSLKLTSVSPSVVEPPKIGQYAMFFNSEDGDKPYLKDSNNYIFLFTGIGSGDIVLEPIQVIYGDEISFNKTDYGSEIDVIETGITEITRGNSQGLFNVAQELSYQNGSPAGTLWNSIHTDGSKYGWLDLTDLEERNFLEWGDAVNWNPPSSIGQELVMKDLSTSKYHLIKILSWTGGAAGGGFSYTRQEVSLTAKKSITFSDGTILNSAPKDVILEAGSGIDLIESVDINGNKVYNISSAGATVNYSNVVFVDAYSGNDATAIIGRFDKPYQTVSAAALAAETWNPNSFSRILVYIRGGLYSGSVNLKNWVDFYCESGVVFFGSGSVRDLGIAVISNFYGYAKFVQKTGSALAITGNSTVNFQFDYIDQSSSIAINITPPVGGQSEVTIEGNKIFSTTLGVGYAIALRRKANVVFNIKSLIWAYHSIFDIRDNYDGILTVNCPKIRLANDNLYGGNFKQAVICYSSTANARMTFNADFVNEGVTYLGGISGMITNWSSTSGIIEVNGNIYAGETVGLYCSGNQTSGRMVVNGNIISNIQPVYVASENSCYVKNGVISKPSTFVANTVRTIQNAKLYMSNVQLYNAAPDVHLIKLDSTTSQLYLYNVIGEATGVASSIETVGLTNIQVHGSRFNKDKNVDAVDVLTPSGFIFDPLLVVPKF